MRFAEMQVWPEFLNLQTIAPATASSRSASSKTMNGALPPSSSETFLSPAAHWLISSFPISVEPVNPSLRTAGFEVSSPPMTGASSAAPVTIDRTPGGKPASSREGCDRERGERGLLGGLQHHRAAGREGGRGLAGHHRRGEVPGRDPGGDADRLLRHEDPLVGPRRRDGVAVDPLRLLAEPLVERRGVGDLDPRLGQRLPLLGDHQACEVVLVLEHQIREAPEDACALFRRAALPSGSALSAAASARRVSAAPMRGTSAIVSPVAGLVTGNVAPESASTHFPST